MRAQIIQVFTEHQLSTINTYNAKLGQKEKLPKSQFSSSKNKYLGVDHKGAAQGNLGMIKLLCKQL